MKQCPIGETKGGDQLRSRHDGAGDEKKKKKTESGGTKTNISIPLFLVAQYLKGSRSKRRRADTKSKDRGTKNYRRDRHGWEGASISAKAIKKDKWGQKGKAQGDVPRIRGEGAEMDQAPSLGELFQKEDAKAGNWVDQEEGKKRT